MNEEEKKIILNEINNNIKSDPKYVETVCLDVLKKLPNDLLFQSFLAQVYRRNPIKDLQHSNNLIEIIKKSKPTTLDEEFAVAKVYYILKEYDTSFKLLLELSKKGHTLSQKLLGDSYHKGNGCTQDNKEAMKWLNLSGDTRSIYNIGIFFERAYGVEQDKDEALKYFYKAASFGHSLAQFKIGRYYFYGFGSLPIDYNNAFRWLKRAKDQKVPAAINFFSPKSKHFSDLEILKCAVKYEEELLNEFPDLKYDRVLYMSSKGMYLNLLHNDTYFIKDCNLCFNFK